jgi:large subunit ribosomal protein L19
MTRAIEKISRANLRADQLPPFKIGDTVKVLVKIKEGEKERIQSYTGIVVARDGGGASETFTVRKTSHGVGVERIFPLHSPQIAGVEVESSGHVRRAKLYYLRQRVGKQAKLREQGRSESQPT